MAIENKHQIRILRESRGPSFRSTNYKCQNESPEAVNMVVSRGRGLGARRWKQNKCNSAIWLE